MDYAAAVNEEIKDLFAAGADIVQIDEPYMQARPEKARQYGLKALNRALEGVQGETAVHICFGYAAIIHARPEGYSFLPEFAGCSCKQVSIETAQSNLDCCGAGEAARQEDHGGLHRSLRHDGRDAADSRRARIKRALQHVQAGERDPRARLRHEVPAARGRRRQAEGDGRRREAAASSTADGIRVAGSLQRRSQHEEQRACDPRGQRRAVRLRCGRRRHQPQDNRPLTNTEKRRRSSARSSGAVDRRRRLQEEPQPAAR